MSKGSSGGKVVIEEEIEDEKDRITEQLNNSVKSIDIESRIVVEEGFYEVDDDEDETSNMSMAVDDVDTKQQSGQFEGTKINDKIEGKEGEGRGVTINFDESDSEALDLSFIPCSIPLKKRKISSLPNNNPNSNTLNEEKVKSDYHHHNHHSYQHHLPSLQHRQHNQFHQKIVTEDSITTTIPSTSAFNQLTNNHLNSFSLQSNHNHFPFSLRAIPSATSSSSSNCKPLSLVKNQIQQLNTHLPPNHQPQPQLHQHHTHQHHHQLQQQQHHHHQQQQYLNQHHRHQHQKFIQYQQQQLRLQDFNVGNKSTIVGSSTSGQTKGMSCRRPGFITCSICNATKYYSHVQRRFGQYSCEPCSKFMKRFLRDPKIFTCSQKGHCTIGKPSGEQEPRGVSVNRCKACWLKICLEKFILDSETRVAIDKYYAPKFSDSCGTLVDIEGVGIGGDVEFEGALECSNNISTSSGNSSRLSDGGGNGGIGDNNGEDGKEIKRLREGDIGGGVCGEGGTRKPSNQLNLSDRIEANGCDTTISPPPLPFPQRKRKPKNETSTPSTSSSLSSSTSTTTQVTTTTTTPGNLMNNGSAVPGESIPLATSLSGNSRIKDKYHHPSHPLHHSHQNQQYPSSFYGGTHPTSNALGGHLLTEPLCLTTTGRRSDLSSSGLLGNLSSNSRSTSFFPGAHLSLSQASLGPRYPWSHRRKDDYDILTSSTTTTSLTTPITFRRELTRPSHHDNLIIRRGSDDDLNDIYSGDYSLISPELLLSGPYVGVSHIIKDSNGDGDDNVTVMGSPATPPPPPPRCGKCTYCLPKIDEKANVVVVKENVGPVRCRLAEVMSKISQSNDKGGGGMNEDSEGQNTEDGVHSSTPTLNNIDNNKNNGRRNRKERRGQSRGVTGGGREGVLFDKEESESGSATTTTSTNMTGSTEEMIMNDDENDNREVLVKGVGSRGGETFYRKRLISEDGDDQSVSIKYLNHDENHHGHHHNNYHNNHHQGSNRSSSTTTSSTTIINNSNTTTTKFGKSGLFNAKPYKKILINEHFVNSTATINNQSTSNSNNPLSSRDLSGSVISPDSNFLSEILNANSPFL